MYVKATRYIYILCLRLKHKKNTGKRIELNKSREQKQYQKGKKVLSKREEKIKKLKKGIEKKKKGRQTRKHS